MAILIDGYKEHKDHLLLFKEFANFHYDMDNPSSLSRGIKLKGVYDLDFGFDSLNEEGDTIDTSGDYIYKVQESSHSVGIIGDDDKEREKKMANMVNMFKSMKNMSKSKKGD